MNKVISINILFFVMMIVVGQGKAVSGGNNNLEPQEKAIRHGIKVLGVVDSSRILLRWAGTTPIAWQQNNKYGVYVERYTLAREDDSGVLKMLPVPEYTLLTSAPLKAASEEVWKEKIMVNDQAAIIAQCLYGEGENEPLTMGSGLGQMVRKIQNDERRFAFSLGAADQNYEAALLAGWGYIDKSVKAGERYLYRVYVATPKEGKIKIDTGIAFLGLMDGQVLPKPAEVFAKYGDKEVLLGWNFGRLRDYFTGYFVERSKDKKYFERLNMQPFVPLTLPDNGFVFYTDTTLPNNEEPFYYRVIGINSFGQLGTPSDTLGGRGLTQLTYMANIQKHIFKPTGDVVLEWEFAKEGEALLYRFILVRARSEGGEEDTISNNISPAARSYEISVSNIWASNYFRLIGEDKRGNRKASLSYFVQPVDSTPPEVPKGLRAEVDTLGRVHLSWQANVEKDLQGYFIVRGNFEKEEMVLLSTQIYKDTVYIDSTLDRKLATEKVYYGVMAVDKRMNQSKPCERVSVAKPNDLSVYAPFFTGYEEQEKQVVIRWAPPVQKSVVMNKLYRKQLLPKEDTGFIELWVQKEFKKNEYIETELKGGDRFSYKMKAFTKDKESKYGNELVVQKQEMPKVVVVENFYVERNTNDNKHYVSWKKPLQPIEQIELFRRKNEGKMERMGIFTPEETKYIDSMHIDYGTYEYGIRTLNKEGIPSPLKLFKIRVDK